MNSRSDDTMNILNELEREFSILCSNLFTEYELPSHRERELMDRRDRCYSYINQLTSLSRGNHG